MKNFETREKIAKVLSSSIVGMRNSEISTAANLFMQEKDMRVVLSHMVTDGYLERSGNCATTRYKLTPQGRLMFISNSESALKQIEKTAVETQKPAQILEESALEQKTHERIDKFEERIFNEKDEIKVCDCEEHLDGGGIWCQAKEGCRFDARKFDEYRKVDEIEATPYPQIEDFETRATQKHFFSELDDDAVFSPLHYNQGGIECIEALRACMSKEEYRGFLRGNVIKYLWRLNDKATPQENIKKARWYLDTLQESF